jgi:hypothetical protein
MPAFTAPNALFSVTVRIVLFCFIPCIVNKNSQVRYELQLLRQQRGVQLANVFSKSVKFP